VKRNFLVVASDARVRETLAGELWNLGFSVTRAVNGAEAERVVRSVSVDAVLTESTLPDMSGEELAARLSRIRSDCRVVVLTSFEQVKNSPEQMRFGAEDYLLRSEQLLQLLDAAHSSTEDEGTSAIDKRGSEALVQVVDVLVGLLEIDDRFFGGFSHQVMLLAREVAEELSAEEDAIQETVIATLLRDIGKVDIEPEILAEEGLYSKEQEARMKAHVDGSVRLFEHVDFPWKVLPIIRHHHERYDGSGYPDGLRGREIPMGARIISVIDAYTALTSGRQHRAPLEADQALTLMISESGRQFDPEVVETLQKVLDKRKVGRKTKGKPRILVADPQDDFRKLVKMRLLNEGYEVTEATSSEKVMERLLKDPPDLMLVDLDAGEEDAFQLLDEIREDESLCRIPFAVLSRRSERILKIKALRMGVDDFLSKNDDLEELTARVGAILTREAIRREGPTRRVRRGITGDLQNLSLPDIIQTLVMGMKTACVTLSFDGHSGMIWFENGAVRHAKTHDQIGENAFFEMVRWCAGEFVIEHGVRCKQISITQDTMYLLMEGMRLLDESLKGETQAVS
jgi:response regulator RpfG family c-di-GMP phosphodiesterase